jgi:hypothetical protein
MVVVDETVTDMASLHSEGWRDSPAAFDSPEADAAELNLLIPSVSEEKSTTKPLKKVKR